MNNNGPAMPMAPFPGRGREFLYGGPSPHAIYPPHNYHPFQHAPPHFHPQNPYFAYQQMQMPMSRPFQPQVPFPLHQYSSSMPPRPNSIPYPSAPSYNTHHGHLSPPPPQMTPAPVVPRPSPPPAPPPVTRRMPFYPPLPWTSVPEADFPKRRARKRTSPRPQTSEQPVELPSRATTPAIRTNSVAVAQETGEGQDTREIREIQETRETRETSAASQTGEEKYVSASEENSGILPVSDTASRPPSDSGSTQPTTPSSSNIARPHLAKSVSRSGGKAGPIVPVIPNMPTRSKAPKKPSVSGASDMTKVSQQSPEVRVQTTIAENGDAATRPPSESSNTVVEPKAAPKSWADLVRRNTVISAQHTNPLTSKTSSSVVFTKSPSFVDVLASFNVASDDSAAKIAFLKPRGLVNTSNMCYMNSVLQMLVFCVPFYAFLDQVGKHAIHRFKSDTPLVDAMIMFMKEYSIIDSAISADRLRMRLKDTEYEDFGDAFIPEYVYEVIRRLPRFASMQRGHQQDAEEFLGFLLEEMHEECVRILQGPAKALDDTQTVSRASSQTEENGWLEVGPKQRSAVTRSSGTVTTESPITKIFGGKLRSEFRVPGAKNSVTLEPYQPLQLDIGSPQVNNITDALRGLTRSETIHGDFKSPRGPGVSATKQVFIDTLPVVLILHLKRFQYDNAGGTQKIWKKIGYPLELEIPKEVFPPHRRGSLAAHGGLPCYRLTGVVYHHGRNASGGHYTVDVRRQDGREWIRLDDTVIRRVRSEEVAAGGSEAETKGVAATETRDGDVIGEHPGNGDDETGDSTGAGWSRVHGTSTTGKKWPSGNGVEEGKRSPADRGNGREGKVAYLLFYQKI